MLGWIVITLLTVCAIGWSLMIFLANGMSDAPTLGFQGLWSIAGIWVVVIGAVVYKLYGR
jgi:hypothetical protein